MAYDVKNIKRFAIGATQNSITAGIWHYKSADAVATVETANYFNALAAELQIGDIIFASLVMGGSPVGRQYMVTANTGTVVTIAPQNVA